MRRTVVRGGVTLIALGLLLAGCTGDGQPSGSGGPQVSGSVGSVLPERVPRTLRIGLGRDPLTIDPRYVSDDEGEFIVRALFDGLVDVSPAGTIRAAAAQRWTIEDDGLTYRFVLRDERFHDGSRVTAQHHADALLAVFDPERAPEFRASLLASLRGAQAEPAEPLVDPGAPSTPSRWGTAEDVVREGGVEVVSESELVLRLVRPDPLLLYRLTDPVLVPLPALATEDPERFAREPIGNGPFRMAGPREPGAFVRLRADADHHAPPLIDELLIQMYPDDRDRSQRWADLLAGRLQIAAVPVERRAEARDRFGVPAVRGVGSGLHDGPTMALYAYGFVLDREPFDDVDLRRAISAAIDREGLADELAAAGVVAADAILPATFGGTAPECPHCRYAPELAEELIAAWRQRVVGAEVEPPIVLSYPRGGGHVSVAERIAADLEGTLGLDVRLQAREFGALMRSVATGDAPLFRYGLRAPLGGDAAGIALLETALRSDGEENWLRWSDTATDRALDAWSPETSLELVRTLEAEVLDAAALVPLLWTRLDLVVLPEVQGFRVDATGRWWPERLQLR